MRRVTVFPEIDALPGSQGAAAIRDREVQVRLGQYAADMRGHVIGAFRRVRVGRIAVWCNPGHERFQVPHDVRVCVFTQHE